MLYLNSELKKWAAPFDSRALRGQMTYKQYWFVLVSVYWPTLNLSVSSWLFIQLNCFNGAHELIHDP